LALAKNANILHGRTSERPRQKLRQAFPEFKAEPVLTKETKKG
jgi:hypothetical protein